MSITSFLIYCFIVTFTPGPTNIVILSTAHNFGTKKAMEYAYGATIAFGLLLGISAVLNTVLIAVIPKILSIMQIIGSCYILYLAYQIYKMDVSESAEIQTATFLSGFLMQFVNPKVVLFTMTVIPSFVMPYYAAPAALAVFAVAITIIGFCAFVTWVLFGVVFKEFLKNYQKTVNMVMALFLVYSALMASGVVELIKR
ncbi:LysE family translocator [Desulfosporosinus youngiae]|uniref:Putative threonine efflux protein n=1 Tax=Desulfosporosinus youngiae DSM 17734 TaxID=768710 RepID=H5XUP3_9FIRM|nr:LysE family transporter [Desulfosporosinus youngiae]EHQ89200.1 putative threonine efflux protein [Desulfosporosinus youngiae DSM 17734]